MTVRPPAIVLVSQHTSPPFTCNLSPA